jgi:hypothetical protein
MEGSFRTLAENGRGGPALDSAQVAAENAEAAFSPRRR